MKIQKSKKCSKDRVNSWKLEMPLWQCRDHSAYLRLMRCGPYPDEEGFGLLREVAGFVRGLKRKES